MGKNGTTNNIINKIYFKNPKVKLTSYLKILCRETDYSVVENITVLSGIQYKIMWFAEDDSHFH